MALLAPLPLQLGLKIYCVTAVYYVREGWGVVGINFINYLTYFFNAFDVVELKKKLSSYLVLDV